MRFQPSPLLAPVLVSAASATYVPASTWGTDVLVAKGLLNLAVYEVQQALAGSSDSCSLSNVAIRREWLVFYREVLSREFLTMTQVLPLSVRQKELHRCGSLLDVQTIQDGPCCCPRCEK